MAMSSYQHHYRIIIRTILALVIAAIGVLTLSRAITFFLITESQSLEGLGADIARAFFIGGRFDLKVVTIAFAPLFLAGLFLAASDRIFAYWKRAVYPYSALIFFLLTAFSIGNYYYYVTYGNYIDVFAFGLFDDDTEAVLEDAWLNYPIFRSFLASVAVAVLAFMGSKKLVAHFVSKQWPSVRGWMFVGSMVIAIAVYVVAARGSIGSLPLKRYHANVSQYKALNVITPNAFMALDWASSDYKKQSKFEPVSEQALTEQMMKVLGQPTPEYQTQKNQYLEENKPHVVMALMEGLGQNVLIEDDAQTNDLLGSLRTHFESDFLFERFLSGTSATIDSIVMMLFHSDTPTISHSNVQRTVLPSSAVLPYKRAGYDVIFLYSGNSMWRNLANYLPAQGFDKVLDENNIKSEFPQAAKQATTWGVPDEYTFKYAYRLLERANKPTLIYIMTTTNHTPYQVPQSYKRKPVQVSERLDGIMGSVKENATEMLGAFQYANEFLGQFITEVKDSDLAERTIIAASGDHRVRSISGSRMDEVAVSSAVPFYLYVPNAILEHSDFQYDNTRVGSHRDIFPTLYHFSLSDSQYITLGGENLLSSEGVTNRGYNKERVITADGAYLNGQPDRLFPWLNDGILTKGEPVDNDNTLWPKEYRKLQDYYLRSQLFEKQ